MKILRNVLASIGCFVLGTTVSLEFRHWYTYGHLVWYGLHVDTVSRDVEVGVPGTTKLYSLDVRNFSLLPVGLPACHSYAPFTPTSLYYAHALQRYNDQSKSWETDVNPMDFQLCVNSETTDSRVVYTYLLPGSSVRVTTYAFDAYFENYRWVVFREVSPTANWDTAVVSEPFRIKNDVERGE